MSNKEEQMTLSEQIVYAIAKPSKYKEMIELKSGRFVKFAIVMVMVLSIISFVVPTAAMIAGFGGFEKLFTKIVPAFTVEDGKLKAEEKYSMMFGNYNVMIDTSESAVADESIKRKGVCIAIGSETVRFVINSGNDLMDYQTFDIKGLFPDGFNNQSLARTIPAIYISFAVTYVFTCVGFFFKYAFFAVVIAILINMINKQAQLHYGFGDMFKIGFYAQTFAMLFSNINSAIGSPIPYFIASFVTVFVSVNMASSAMKYIAKDYFDKRNL